MNSINPVLQPNPSNASLIDELKSLHKQKKIIVFHALATSQLEELIQALGQEWQKRVKKIAKERLKKIVSLINLINTFNERLGKCPYYHEAKTIKSKVRDASNEIFAVDKFLEFKILTNVCSFNYSKVEIQKIFKTTIDDPGISLANAWDHLKDMTLTYSDQNIFRSSRKLLYFYMLERLSPTNTLELKNNYQPKLNQISEELIDSLSCGNEVYFEKICPILSKFSKPPNLPNEIWTEILNKLKDHVKIAIIKAKKKRNDQIKNLFNSFVICLLSQFKTEFFTKIRHAKKATPFALGVYSQQFMLAKYKVFELQETETEIWNQKKIIHKNLKKYHSISEKVKIEKKNMGYRELKSDIFKNFCEVSSFCNEVELTTHSLSKKATFKQISHFKNSISNG